MVNKITLAKSLINSRSQRASVIPYIARKKSLWFLLGIDANSGDITDFGGGVKLYENDFEAAWREFNEETKNIFSNDYTKENLSSCVCLNKAYSNDSVMSCIFLPIKKDWYEKACLKFDERIVKNRYCKEISQVIWIRDDEFYKLINRMSKKKLWYRLVMFYKNFEFGKLKDILIKIFNQKIN